MSGSIMEFSQDLATAEAPEPLPAGPYPAEIIAAQPRVSSTTGNHYASIQFRIPAHAYPADFTEGDPEGIVLVYNRMPWGVDSATARWTWRKFLENVGLTPTKKIDLIDLIGLTASVEVTHQEYEGQMRAQIAKVLAA